MTKRKEVSDAKREQELAKLDLLPKREGHQRADDLLRSLLNTPPEPYTPKPAKKRAKRARG